jgi:phosphoribosylformylglycinamidine (FGAM) synthase-like amidotransferase family enzyme
VLGVCNGCQLMSNLHEIIPGAGNLTHFARNRSEQFEARFVMVEVQPSPSIFFNGMVGSRMPIVVSHGEGYADFGDDRRLKAAQDLVTLRHVDHRGNATETYLLNPNGSPQGITGLTTPDGRFSIMMPHPERVFRAVQNSWYPRGWQRTAHGCACSRTQGNGWGSCRSGFNPTRQAEKKGDRDGRLFYGPCVPFDTPAVRPTQGERHLVRQILDQA